MKRKYQVAVILINYNSSHHTINCVNSILDQTSGEVTYQIIVVDNNSAKEDCDKLDSLKDIEHLTLYKSRINIGFSGGNMLGVQLADAENYFFLNNDCILLNDNLHQLLGHSKAHPNTGICAGKMFDEKMEQEPNFNSLPTLTFRILGPSLLRMFNPEKYPKRKVNHENPIKVGFVSGSAMFVRGALFDEIGGFDTNYFLYCEEEDMALRVQRKGYDVMFVPTVKYQHLGGQSTTFNLPILKEFYISSLYYYRKNHGNLHRKLVQGIFFFKNIKKFYKSSNFVKLAFFILGGAHMKHSLRFKQRIG